MEKSKQRVVFKIAYDSAITCPICPLVLFNNPNRLSIWIKQSGMNKWPRVSFQPPSVKI